MPADVSPYFLKDNATFAGISVNETSMVGGTKLLKAAKEKYNSYGSEWEKVYFDKFSAGYNVYHKAHQFAPTDDGGNAEKTVGKMLAKHNGKQVEFMPEGETMSADVRFDGQTWEIKYINNANIKTIRGYIELTRRKGADNSIFYWDGIEKIDLLRAAVQSETGKMHKLGRIDEIPDIYYMDKSGLLKLLWKK